MTFTQVRNAIVSGLENYVGCPVVLSDQISNMPGFPYCYYSVLTPRTSSHYFGLEEITEDGTVLRRSEPVSATMSFTFCSQNRQSGDDYIFGEDEALELAEKAHCFFLLHSRCLHTEYGDIVLLNLDAPANRSGFVVEDTIRRYGFDVRVSYVRTDEIPTTTLARVSTRCGN